MINLVTWALEKNEESHYHYHFCNQLTFDSSYIMRRLGYVATAHRADDPTLTFNLITEVICLQYNRNERGVLGGVLGLDRTGRDNNVKIPRVIEKKTPTLPTLPTT